MKPENDEDIPEFEAIYRDDSDDEESQSNSDDDENDDYGNKKKSRFDESAILKRRDRRLWEDQRKKILFDYEQFSYIGKLILASTKVIQMYSKVSNRGAVLNKGIGWNIS